MTEPPVVQDKNRQNSDAHHAWIEAYPDDVSWEMPLTPAPVYTFFDQTSATSPKNTCTNFFGKLLTYGEIAKLVDHVASGLQATGVAKGTKVGILLPNCPAFIVYYYAILKVGGVVVNYNPLYSEEELKAQAEDCETELMITCDLKLLFDKVEALLSDGILRGAVVCRFGSQLPPAKAILHRLMKRADLANLQRSSVRGQIRTEDELLANAGQKPQPVPINPEQDLAVIQYTGGTTGTPKGAMLTHANLIYNLEQVQAWTQSLEFHSERTLAVLPFFHVFAMTVVMNLGLAMGAELVIMPRFSLDDTLDLIQTKRPTILVGVPTLFNAILNHPKTPNLDLTSLKFCLSGGAPLPAEVKQAFEALTNCPLVEGYGLSEASPVVTCNPLTGPTRKGSIGLPLPRTIVSLREISDPTKEVAQGQRGEICVKGPQVMQGYWNRPAETAAQFVGPFLRTGDVGVMDKDGFFTIVDRIKDLILCSGYNVYPRRIEEALYEHPAVHECTVIGIPDKYRGEAPKAFVKLKANADTTPQDLIDFITPKLSKIELPAEIELRDALPKTIIGKLSKKELKAEYDNTNS